MTEEEKWKTRNDGRINSQYNQIEDFLQGGLFAFLLRKNDF
jgi:hypothetical protein